MKMNKQQKKLLKDLNKDVKMIFVVNNSLKMGKGKIGAQCSHASIGLYKKLLKSSKVDILNSWENTGSKKVVVKVKNESDMNKIFINAEKFKIPTHMVIDAGKTQIAEGSQTVLALFGESRYLNQFTNHLKLM